MLWYSLEAPQQGVSNEYHNICFCGSAVVLVFFFFFFFFFCFFFFCFFRYVSHMLIAHVFMPAQPIGLVKKDIWAVQQRKYT